MRNYTSTKGNMQAILLISDVKLPCSAKWVRPGHWQVLPVFEAYPGEIVREGFVDDDFLDTLIRFFGGRLDAARIWRALGMSVTWRNSLGIVGHEEGWRRYHLGSVDGIVRSGDRQAPTVMVTPRRQALFQASPRHRIRPLNRLIELVEAVADLCPEAAEVTA